MLRSPKNCEIVLSPILASYVRQIEWAVTKTFPISSLPYHRLRYQGVFAVQKTRRSPRIRGRTKGSSSTVRRTRRIPTTIRRLCYTSSFNTHLLLQRINKSYQASNLTKCFLTTQGILGLTPEASVFELMHALLTSLENTSVAQRVNSLFARFCYFNISFWVKTAS